MDSRTGKALALVSTRLPGPTARILVAEVEIWPSPQIIVSAAQLVGVTGDLGRPCEAGATEVVGVLATRY